MIIYESLKKVRRGWKRRRFKQRWAEKKINF